MFVMDRTEVLERLKFLHDQVHQTAERIRHLPQSIPFHVHPQSLNYEEDLEHIKAEYRWLAGEACRDQTLSPEELVEEGLPAELT